MLFNSYAFLLAFLPIAVLGYFALNRWRGGLAGNAWLVACSLFFYAYWRFEFVGLLLASIAVNFLVGRAIVQRASRGAPTKALLAAGIAFDLLLLAYFKYANFFAENIATVLGVPVPRLDVVLPIGISFFTFTQIAFLVDAHQRKAAEPGLVNYTLFVTYFPHLLAGPILHHREMMPQFADPALRRVDWDNVARGLALLAMGLGKKVLLADPLAGYANAGFADPGALTLVDGWLTVLAYTMQIYFDFSGYTDMALGMALMMNIRLPRNFDSPYRSTDLREFWRRWHMTLMRFLRDYVYIPLGGNRRGEVVTALLLVATFTLGGLWHGANWTFVLWGLANGLGLVIARAWSRAGRRLPITVAWTLTFVSVMLGWVLFRATDLAGAGQVYSALFGMHGFSSTFRTPDAFTSVMLVLACLLALLPRNADAIAHGLRFSWPARFATAILLVAAVVSLSNPTEFLYFNF